MALFHRWKQGYFEAEVGTTSYWNDGFVLGTETAETTEAVLLGGVVNFRFSVGLAEDMGAQVWPGYARSHMDIIAGAQYNDTGLNNCDLKADRNLNILVSSQLTMTGNWFWSKPAGNVQEWDGYWQTVEPLRIRVERKATLDNLPNVTFGILPFYSESIPAEGLDQYARTSCWYRILWGYPTPPP